MKLTQTWTTETILNVLPFLWLLCIFVLMEFSWLDLALFLVCSQCAEIIHCCMEYGKHRPVNGNVQITTKFNNNQQYQKQQYKPQNCGKWNWIDHIVFDMYPIHVMYPNHQVQVDHGSLAKLTVLTKKMWFLTKMLHANVCSQCVRLVPLLTLGFLIGSTEEKNNQT